MAPHKMLSCFLPRACTPLFCLWAVLLPVVSLNSLNDHEHQDHLPKLLLVSFDGFRWDYIDRVPTPNFRRIMDSGVKVEFVENVYVTKTYPNHYSMVTGLHAETHGIVANEMYDPTLNLSSTETNGLYDSRWWEEAVPLWVTVQKDGGRSGAAMWPGSDVKIHGTFPTRYLQYNASVSFEYRVERIIEWFSAPEEEAVDFGVLYWEEPDESGHNLGPQSPLMDAIIAGIDEKLGFLMDELKKAGLYEKVNLIVTSDHGMAQLSPEKIIELDEYVDRDLYTWVDKSPVVGILPKEGKTLSTVNTYVLLQQAMKHCQWHYTQHFNRMASLGVKFVFMLVISLKGKLDEVFGLLVDANPNMVAYKKEDVPVRFHYQHNARIMPILLEAKEGWTIMQNRSGPFMRTFTDTVELS